MAGPYIFPNVVHYLMAVRRSYKFAAGPGEVTPGESSRNAAFFAFHYVIESKFYSVSTNDVQHRPTKRTTLFTTKCVSLVFWNGN